MLNKLCSLLCTLLAITAFFTSPTVHANLLDKVVAIVNDGVITESEINQQLLGLKRQLEAKKIEMPSEDILRKQVLDHTIDLTVQLQMAKQLGIKIDNASLNQALRDIAKRNKVTLSQMRDQIQSHGLSFRKYREDIRNEMIIARLQQQEVGKYVKISNQQINEYVKLLNKNNTVKEYHLKNILIPLPEAPTPEQVKQANLQANNIVKQLRGGADFSKTALAESAGQQALEGGDLGWRKLAEIPEIFGKKIRDLQANDIAGPIRTGNGFHIIKLVDVRGKPEKHTVKQTKARHILIKTDAITLDDEVIRRLNTIKKQIKDGTDFAVAAEANSEDFASASQGGDLGWISPGDMVHNFEVAMDKLKPNEISEPIQSQYGWHLIQVLDRHTLDDTENFKRRQIRQQIYKRKFEEGVQYWIQSLKNEAYIKIVE